MFLGKNLVKRGKVSCILLFRFVHQRLAIIIRFHNLQLKMKRMAILGREPSFEITKSVELKTDRLMTGFGPDCVKTLTHAD